MTVETASRDSRAQELFFRRLAKSATPGPSQDRAIFLASAFATHAAELEEAAQAFNDASKAARIALEKRLDRYESIHPGEVAE